MKVHCAKIKKGWEGEGKTGIVLGKPVFVEQAWTPILWDDEEDPTWFKAAGLELFDENISPRKVRLEEEHGDRFIHNLQVMRRLPA